MSAVGPRLPTTESPASRDSRLARLQPEPALQKKRFYLPEVDGIRCLAVLLVWIHHYPEGPGVFLHQLRDSGWVGVNIFLVLSSFLITSLLMLEAQAKGSISLPQVLQQTVSADLAAFGAGASPELFTFTCNQLLPGRIW